MGGEAGMGLRVRASSLLLSLVLELAVALVSGNSSRSRRLGRSLLACITVDSPSLSPCSCSAFCRHCSLCCESVPRPPVPVRRPQLLCQFFRVLARRCVPVSFSVWTALQEAANEEHGGVIDSARLLTQL